MTVVVSNPGEAGLLLALIFGIFTVQFSGWSLKTKRWYEEVSKHVRGSPPKKVSSWFFTIAWILLYLLLITSCYNYLTHEVPGVHYDTFAFVTAILVTLMHMWTPIFFKLKSPRVALVVAILMLVFTLVLFSISILDDEGLSWGCLIPWILWLVYACYLNIMFVAVLNAHQELKPKEWEKGYYGEVNPIVASAPVANGYTVPMNSSH